MTERILPTKVASLDDWVLWLVETYELATRIPACWAQHPGVVAECDGLWDVYTKIGDKVTIDGFHVALGAALVRIGGSAASRCALSWKHHKPETWPAAKTP